MPKRHKADGESKGLVKEQPTTAAVIKAIEYRLDKAIAKCAPGALSRATARSAGRQRLPIRSGSTREAAVSVRFFKVSRMHT